MTLNTKKRYSRKKKVRNIKKRNTKKRIFRRKKTKRKNNKKRKTRRMRGGSTIKPLELENVSLDATTKDDDFFRLAKTEFKYTTDTMSWEKRKRSVIQMLKTLKEKVSELKQAQENLDAKGVELATAKEDLVAKEGELKTAQKDLETLNTMASNEGIITKPPGQFSPKFNTIANKLVNLSNKDGQLKQAQKEHASALTEKETELEKVKEEHASALAKKEGELKQLDTMASSDQKQKPQGNFSNEFNTIAGKLVDLHMNVDELNGKLTKAQSNLAAKVEQLTKAQSALDAKNVSSSSERPQQCSTIHHSSNYYQQCCEPKWETLSDREIYNCNTNRIK